MWSFPKVIIYKIYDAFNVSGANDSFVSAKVRPPIIEKKIIGERIQIPRENFYGKEKKKRKKKCIADNPKFLEIRYISNLDIALNE